MYLNEKENIVDAKRSDNDEGTAVKIVSRLDNQVLLGSIDARNG